MHGPSGPPQVLPLTIANETGPGGGKRGGSCKPALPSAAGHAAGLCGSVPVLLFGLAGHSLEAQLNRAVVLALRRLWLPRVRSKSSWNKKTMDAGSARCPRFLGFWPMGVHAQRLSPRSRRSRFVSSPIVWSMGRRARTNWSTHLSLRHEPLALHASLLRSLRMISHRLADESSNRLPWGPRTPGLDRCGLCLHDRDELGPRMLARLAKVTGLKPVRL